MLMVTTLSMVVTYDEGFPPVTLHDPSIMLFYEVT